MPVPAGPSEHPKRKTAGPIAKPPKPAGPVATPKMPANKKAKVTKSAKAGATLAVPKLMVADMPAPPPPAPLVKSVAYTMAGSGKVIAKKVSAVCGPVAKSK